MVRRWMVRAVDRRKTGGPAVGQSTSRSIDHCRQCGMNGELAQSKRRRRKKLQLHTADQCCWLHFSAGATASMLTDNVWNGLGPRSRSTGSAGFDAPCGELASVECVHETNETDRVLDERQCHARSVRSGASTTSCCIHRVTNGNESRDVDAAVQNG